MSTKRVSRGRPLAPEEAAGYRQVREQVAGELADLIARHEQRTGVAHEAAAIIPAATVRLVRSSMRMKAPVVRLRP